MADETVTEEPATPIDSQQDLPDPKEFGKKPEVEQWDDLGDPIATLPERRRLGAEIDTKYSDWRMPRRVHELRWFTTAAYRRGKQSSDNTASLASIQDLQKVNRKKRNIANKLWAKGRARFAKFARSRPKAIVVPFTADRKARIDARQTERSLDYLYERSQLEQKYYDAILWAADTGKSYWWLTWDPSKMTVVKKKNADTGTESLHDIQDGDIAVTVDSAFPILVPDLRKTHIGDQDEIMRVVVDDTEELKAKYQPFAEFIKVDSHKTSPFEFERQIAHLSGSDIGTMASMSGDTIGAQKGSLVKELYQKPTTKYPKGRRVVVVNTIAVKVQNELPHGFYDMANPYPCVEFMDMPQVGQFYCTTFAEQLIPLQRGYNMLRDRLEQQIKMNVHMKWIVAKQARVSKSALTNESGEVVEYNFIPGMPEPHSVTPASISADVWRFAQLIRQEFDDISQVQPAYEGKAGTAKSGLQTNLLQEASDNVHSPDARGFELAIQDAAYKFRRMMKRGYTIPRLLSFSGRSNIPEVFEFSKENIDEHSTIVVQIGSALSQFKATRIAQMVELHEKGLLGDPNDPELKRRVLGLLDIGGLEQFQEEARQDEDMARMENIDILDGKPIPIPQFYEDHMAHYTTHTEELKSPANRDVDEVIKKKLIAHTLLHLKWFNPQAAYTLALEVGLPELIEEGLIKPVPPQVNQAPPQQGKPAGAPGQVQRPANPGITNQ